MSAFAELLSLSERDKQSRGVLHTPAEIAQQPSSWQKTFALFENKHPEIVEFLGATGLDASDPRDRPTVFLIGAGTSDYIGQSLAILLRQQWQCEVQAVPSTDLLTQLEEISLRHKKYLWISFSRSGDSPEGVEVLQRARRFRPDIYQLVISCNANGKMVHDHAADPHVLSVCLDDAVNDRGLAMTSSFSNMVIFGQCLAHFKQLEHYEKVLNRLVEAGNEFLPVAANCASVLAKESFNKACFVGSGSLRAAAKECSLKLLEMTAGRIITMSESALGLRHGPMAALDENTLFVCFLSSIEPVQAYERALLREIKNKKLVSTRVAVWAAPGSARKSVAEYDLIVSEHEFVADEYRPVLDVIFGQMLGLFFSIRSGLQPDCPSPNGAISRVVQSVV